MKWKCSNCGRSFNCSKDWMGTCIYCDSINIDNDEMKADYCLVANDAILDVLDEDIPELNRQVLNDALVELERIYKILKSK